MAAPLPGGTGSYHVIVPMGLITLFDLPNDDAVAFVFVFHAWQTLTMIAGGVVSLILATGLSDGKAADKIKDLTSAIKIVLQWKKDGKKVVFTNGCFDILHLGHVDYLEKARALGDRLVLGLNTDDSVSRFKGPFRPIQGPELKGSHSGFFAVH